MRDKNIRWDSVLKSKRDKKKIDNLWKQQLKTL